MKTKRMTLMKSLSFKGWIILFSILLFVLGGYSETLGAGGLYLCENPSAHRYFGPQDIVYASKNILRGWIESVCKEKFTVEMGVRLGHRKGVSRSEDRPIVLFVFIGVWGIAILFILGVILYQIVIDPLVKKRRLRRNKMQ
jgi:hypothetical protein